MNVQIAFFLAASKAAAQNSSVPLGPETGEILAETRFPTTAPEETLARAVDFFKEQIQALGPLASIGVASFGPLDPRPASATFGRILPTPKPGWTNADMVGPLRAAFDVPDRL